MNITSIEILPQDVRDALDELLDRAVSVSDKNDMQIFRCISVNVDEEARWRVKHMIKMQCVYGVPILDNNLGLYCFQGFVNKYDANPTIDMIKKSTIEYYKDNWLLKQTPSRLSFVEGVSDIVSKCRLVFA